MTAYLAPLHITVPTWPGETCSEEMENSCELEHDCENGAPCSGSLEDYSCDCPTGLQGEFCEINPNDCIGNPCQRILLVSSTVPVLVTSSYFLSVKSPAGDSSNLVSSKSLKYLPNLPVQVLPMSGSDKRLRVRVYDRVREES